MNSKTFWVWMLFTTMSAMLLFPALSPEIAHGASPSAPPTPASYTLPFTPIVNNKENPVGNLTITNASFIPGIMFPFGNLSFKWDNGTFSQTLSFATQDTSTGTGNPRTGNILINWIENLEIFKTDLISNPWFNYSSRVPGAQLISVQYNTTLGWSNLATAPSSWYAYFLLPGTPPRYYVNLSLANMNPAWNDNVTNGTVLARIKYSYNIRISSWQVSENSTITMLPNITNSIRQTYHENFMIDDNQLFDGLGNPLLTVNLSYIPFNRDDVILDSVWIKDIDDANPFSKLANGSKYTQNAGNNITRLIANGSCSFQVFFNASFTIQFDQAVNPPHVYAVDRLASDNYIREHWYYVKVTGGPNLLRISNLNFTDTNVAYADTISASTYFERGLTKSENNVTIVVDEETTNQVNNGTTLNGGYFVSGETDVLMLSYRAARNLTILIADQIITPVPGASVTLLRDGIPYGSFISRAETYTQPPKLADERGIVVFTHLPSFGNYSISVDLAGTNYGIYYVDVTKTPNVLTTTIPHFPTWIIIWSSFCALITIFGYSKYKRFKNVPEDETR